MTEKTISLENIDYRDFFASKSAILERIKTKFPELKIHSRGSKIKVQGEDEVLIDTFEKKLKQTTTYLSKYGHLSEEVIDQIFDATTLQTKPQAKGENSNPADDIIIYGNNGLVVKPRSVNQKRLVVSSIKNDLMFAVGPAGTGKTYTAIAMAVRALRNKEVKKIILTRPAVEAGEKLGFLPGDMKDKLDPYLQPLYDALHDMIPVKKLEEYIETSIVQIVPLAYMRGRTLDNAFVILDEAQNATSTQLKMFLTRMGRSAKFIVTGDFTQIDLPHKSDSGLEKTCELLKDIEGIEVIKMQQIDIVRHKLVKRIVEAFDK